MNKLIYPGTFDPITNGHLDIITRSAKLFPKVLIAIAANPSKNPIFSHEERIKLVEESVKSISNVEVIGFSGLLADVIKKHQITGIIRGVRAVSDFEYEMQLCHLNRLLTNGVESIFFPPSPEWAFLSSTIVREVNLHGGDIAGLVPECVKKAIQHKNTNYEK